MYKKKIGVIGSGYIGLVVGACLADENNNIICCDIDEDKIENLKNGKIPIYEPGLEELITQKFSGKFLDFTVNIEETIKNAEIIFIAVNTPTLTDGTSDLTAVKNVAKIIGENLNGYKIVCLKSTVPIGTNKIVHEIINKNKKNFFDFDIVSTPEFLREGSAINDFMNPDRIIIGTNSDQAFNKICEIYKNINCKKELVIRTDNLSAETIKYVSNSFLALKVSFINEIANFCDQVGVDVAAVSQGVGLDKRIGSQFLKPGPGFGGSCFPKDIHALIKMAENNNIELETIKAAVKVNEKQKIHVVEKLKKLLNNSLNKKKIAILGLAFKGKTDDIRKSPAIDIILQLKKENVIVNAYDPKANENMKREITDINYFSDVYKAIENADAILILTDWDEFKKLDFKKIALLMQNRIIFDTRNILNFDELISLNFVIDSIGRSCLLKQENYLKLNKNNYNEAEIV